MLINWNSTITPSNALTGKRLNFLFEIPAYGTYLEITLRIINRKKDRSGAEVKVRKEN
jgi:hypothetical protein